MIRNDFRAIAAAAFVALAAPRFAAAQSLGDFAHKEEERRKEIKQPSKVITNKDLSATPQSSTPPPAAPATAATAPAKDKEAKDAEPPKDQAYWSGRLKALQQTLDRDQTFADALQTKLNSQNTDFVNRDDPAQRAVIERERQKTVAEINRLKTQVEQDKKAIADLQEEARRAGVPPGWLR